MQPDRIPPYSDEAEKSILGCVIFDGNRAADLKPEWFYSLNHRSIAEVAISLSLNGGPVDAHTITQQLQFPEAARVVSECADAMAGSFDWWAEILTGYATVRKIIAVASGMVQACYDPMAAENAAELLDKFEREALAIRHEANDNGCNASDLKKSVLEVIAEWEEAAQLQKPRGLETGFGKLDSILGGMKPQELIILAARPSIGKTSFAMNVADYVAVGQGIPVGVFSLEMSTKELVARLTCSRAAVDLGAMNSGRGTERELARVFGETSRVGKAPLFIADKGGISLPRLTSASRRFVQRHKIQLLIVDYLGLVGSGIKSQTRYEATSSVSNGLKLIAKELDIPVIALCQLNRASEKDGRAPNLHDLRDSGAIEQDADVVILLHRQLKDQQGDDKPLTVDCIVAKHRNGPTGHTEMLFTPRYTKFTESTGIPQDAGIKPRKDSYGYER